MVNRNKCEVCSTQAIYNYKNEKKPKFCKQHCLAGMVDILNKKCLVENCVKQPTYNYNDQKKGLYCKQHKLNNMVDVKHKTCIKEGCTVRASFNFKCETKVIYCFTHKLEGMVNINKKVICFSDNCNKIPSYNYNGEKHALYCCKHKLENMVDVNHQMCIFEGCETRPNFGYKEDNSPTYCFKHKLNNMFDIKSKTCIIKECDTRASYGYKKDNKILYCSSHKLKGMTLLSNKNRCLFKYCNKQPNYNYKEEKKGLYCFTHKLEDMVDIKHTFCEIVNCAVRASYGFCGEERIRCSNHKEKYMFVNPKKVCMGSGEEVCKEISTYGISEPVHCEEHSLEKEVCFIFSTCKGCGNKGEVLTREGLCINKCDLTKSFEKHKSYQKVKEEAMLKYLDENISLSNNILKVTDDKIVDISCNKYRPDRVYDCGTHMVIVECDEGQHKNRSFCSSFKHIEHAELSRMHEIQNAAGITCIFLRWNPDNFRVEGNLCKKYSNTQRLKLLVKWVEHCFTMVPDK